MPAITSLGIGSGMDINSIVSQLVELERRPLQQMQTDATALKTQVSSYGKIQSLFSALQDASNKLSGASLWGQSVATSADSASVSVSAGSGASTGNYSVNVTTLAASQSAVSTAAAESSASLAGAGTLSFEMGTWESVDPDLDGVFTTVFTPRVPAALADVAISDTDTLATMRDKINAAGTGVTASIVTDASGARLSLRSTATGVENGFRVVVADGDGDDAAGLSRFAYDPENGANQMLLKQPASNALATINGIDISSNSNTLTGVLDGLNLKLNKVTTSPIDVGVDTDTAAISTAITAFATAYSDLAKYINDQTKYDAASNTGGPLQGDSTATSLQNRLRAVLNTPSGASSSFARLSDLGLQLQRDGTLSVNKTKVDAALSNLPELKKAFGNSDLVDASNNGFAKRYGLLASAVLGSDGALTTKAEGLRKAISNNSKRQDQLNDRVEQFQKRLVEQYTAMDRNVSKLSALGSFVSQQLAAMSKTNTN